jgi:hypothetical protein
VKQVFLTGEADIPVIGSETIRLMEEHRTDALHAFIRSMTAPDPKI